MGFHAKQLLPNPTQEALLELCVVDASLMDRFSSLISGFYIIFGIVGGISILFEEPCTYDESYQDWPFISMLFIWTLPVIYYRALYGNVVFKLPSEMN
ncbi:20127_t:CDS:1, partial [Racocetra persica]